MEPNGIVLVQVDGRIVQLDGYIVSTTTSATWTLRPTGSQGVQTSLTKQIPTFERDRDKKNITNYIHFLGKNVIRKTKNLLSLSKKLSKFSRYNTKRRGKRDTTRNIPRSISFSMLHFMIYIVKLITFGTV